MAGWIGRMRALVGKWIANLILLGFLLAAALAFVFLRLASEMAEGDTLGTDRWIMQALRNASDPSMPVGPAWLRAAMIDLTALGGVSVLTLLTVVVALYLLVARKAATALFMVAAISGGALIGTGLKAAFMRPRPDIVAHLVDVHSTSFPSGHATNSAVVYLTLGALLARTQQNRALRAYLMIVAIALTLTVGFSRVYLGVHWPSDVVAGWCVGAAWATLCAIVARFLQRYRTLEQPSPDQDPEAQADSPKSGVGG